MSYLSVLRKSLNSHLDELEDELGADLHIFDAKPCDVLDDPANPPSLKAVQLIEQVRVDLKAIESIVTPSQPKVVALAGAQYSAAALGGAVLLDATGAIERLGGEAKLDDLAKETG